MIIINKEITKKLSEIFGLNKFNSKIVMRSKVCGKCYKLLAIHHRYLGGHQKFIVINPAIKVDLGISLNIHNKLFGPNFKNQLPFGLQGIFFYCPDCYDVISDLKKSIPEIKESISAGEYIDMPKPEEGKMSWITVTDCSGSSAKQIVNFQTDPENMRDILSKSFQLALNCKYSS
jgi:hypothetical protein